MKILAIAFLLLLLAVLWPSIFKIIKKETPAKTEINFSGYSLDNISKLSIKKAGEEVILEKSGIDWKIKDFLADKDKISVLVKSLAELKINSLASQNKENYADYEITEELGYLLTIIKDGREDVLVIGKMTPAYDGFYIRKKDADKVYSADSNLREQLTLSPDSWRDKKIVNITKDNLQKIEVSVEKKFFLEKNKEGKWDLNYLNKKKTLEAVDSDPIFSLFMPLLATDFATAEEKKFFENTRIKWTVVLKDNDKILAKLELVKKESFWLVKTEGKPDLFKIDESILSPLTGVWQKI